jgi:hypothetical protein
MNTPTQTDRAVAFEMTLDALRGEVARQHAAEQLPADEPRRQHLLRVAMGGVLFADSPDLRIGLLRMAAVAVRWAAALESER